MHTDVKEIGYLKGSKEEKIGSFFKPIKDNVAGGNANFLLEKWAEDGLIEFESPYFIKGRSLHNYSVLVDEAEDMTFNTVKLIGTRLGENSSVCFVGDYKQTEMKYMNNNGLLNLIEETKNSELVGYVELTEDIRSDVSKMFAEL